MSSTWHGQVALGHGWACFRGAAGDNRAHRHPAVQIAIRTVATALIVLDTGVRRVHGALCIPSNLAHRIEPIDDVLLFYVEAQSYAGRSLNHACAGQARTCGRSRASSLLQTLQTDQANPQARIDDLLRAFGATTAPPRSPSALRLAAELDALGTRGELPGNARDLARRVALSKDQLARISRRETGLAPRAELRWLRLQRAMRALLDGASVTRAAHAAGFADAAHFSRTLRVHLGVAPSSLTLARR